MDEFDRQNRTDISLERVPGLEISSDMEVDMSININDLISSLTTLGTLPDNSSMGVRANMYSTARDACSASTLRDVLLKVVDGAVPEEAVRQWLYNDQNLEKFEAQLIRTGYPALFESFLESHGITLEYWDNTLHED